MSVCYVSGDKYLEFFSLGGFDHQDDPYDECDDADRGTEEITDNWYPSDCNAGYGKEPEDDYRLDCMESNQLVFFLQYQEYYAGNPLCLF